MMPPEFVEALKTIVAASNRAGVVPGIHSTGGLTPRRLELGFRMVTVASDLVAMRLGVAAELERAHQPVASAVDGAIY